MWKLFNSLTNNKFKNSSTPSKLIADSGVVTDATDICAAFNAFFAVVGSSLANNIPIEYHCHSRHSHICDTQVGYVAELTDFAPATSDEIEKIINNLNPNCSTGLDGISCNVVKCLKSIILNDLKDCINKCLLSGKISQFF